MGYCLGQHTTNIYNKNKHNKNKRKKHNNTTNDICTHVVFSMLWPVTMHWNQIHTFYYCWWQRAHTVCTHTDMHQSDCYNREAGCANSVLSVCEMDQRWQRNVIVLWSRCISHMCECTMAMVTAEKGTGGFPLLQLANHRKRLISYCSTWRCAFSEHPQTH